MSLTNINLHQVQEIEESARHGSLVYFHDRVIEVKEAPEEIGELISRGIVSAAQAMSDQIYGKTVINEAYGKEPDIAR